MDEILFMLESGRWWPALAAGLMALTYFIRRGGADAWLLSLAQRIPGADDNRQLSHLRAWIPLGLAGMAWSLAVALPLDVGTREAAHTLLLSTIAAMAGHDIVAASSTLVRVLLRRKAPPASGAGGTSDGVPRDEPMPRTGEFRVRRVRSGPGGAALTLLLCLSAMIPAGACASPRSRPLASYSDIPNASRGTSDVDETRAECRTLRERAIWSGASSAAAGVLASGLGAVGLATDHDRAQLSLSLSAVVVAALGAGLALLATDYSDELDNHCTPWPARERTP